MMSGIKFGIENCAILIMRSGKRQRMEGIELPNQEQIRTLGKNETYKYLEILEADTIKQEEMKADTIKQEEMKEKKLKRSHENAETTLSQTIWQKSHQRHKHLGCPPCNILGTILKVDETRISTNEP